jgi:ATP synthase protein I
LTPEERRELERRSSELGRKLREARQEQGGQRRTSAGSGKSEAMARAFRVSAELIGGIVVGGAMGWYLDSWLGSRPWLFILFFLLGTAAGMMNVIRMALREKTPPLPSVPDERDEKD